MTALDGGRGPGRLPPGGLDVLTLRGDRVAEVVSVLTADFGRFGLPGEIPG
ncbi:hypothetical protein [Kibdelosporangium aridum]|uniref:hypothetical protein n=1 Tax=Kibdelosporangium aridum TaxID=2030 RepID=UPI000B1D48F5|nr:hypothetical protein [Kibdelosporangium aridum]